MTFAGLALNLVRLGVKNPVETNDKLYFAFDQKHYVVEFHPSSKGNVDLVSLREYIPHHNDKNETVYMKWFKFFRNPSFHPYGDNFFTICDIFKERANIQ